MQRGENTARKEGSTIIRRKKEKYIKQCILLIVKNI